MPRHSETRYLPYTPEQLFDLVADVEHYHEFLPWVVAVRVRSSNETETVADLVVGFNAFKERFTSRVQKERPTQICVDYVEGPLKYLHNEWRFERAPDGGTGVPEVSCVERRARGHERRRTAHPARPRSERDGASVDDGSLTPLARALLALAEQLRGEGMV